MHTRQQQQQTSGEHGQAIIMLAMTLAVMLGMLALSIDIGQGYTIKRQQQNAADAGALAGASIVSEYGSNGYNADVLNAVHTVVAGNGASNPVVLYVD
ncbi:MAG TPA: pilus assembly protein TadG-related protein, partial [Chloroflexota bacterium]